MTFTKGIGTPVYMAPEILRKEKYKTYADIYSFAMTMFEVMKWGVAYPEEMLKFPWTVAQFVETGQRLPLDCIKNEMRPIIL
jgi:serine/threonine protein kinase